MAKPTPSPEPATLEEIAAEQLAVMRETLSCLERLEILCKKIESDGCDHLDLWKRWHGQH